MPENWLELGRGYRQERDEFLQFGDLHLVDDVRAPNRVDGEGGGFYIETQLLELCRLRRSVVSVLRPLFQTALLLSMYEK